MLLLFGNALQTFDPSAPDQVDKKRFHGIVGMVGCQNPGVAMRFDQFLEPVVAELTGRHLRGKLVFSSIFPGIEMDGMAVCIDGNGIVFTKSGIGIGLVSAQLKIAMRQVETIARLVKQVGQNNRIYPAAKGN